MYRCVEHQCIREQTMLDNMLEERVKERSEDRHGVVDRRAEA